MNSPADTPDRIAQEYGMLIKEYGRVQSRCSSMLAQQAADIASLQADNMRLRAQLIVRDSQLAYARQDMAELKAAIPGLPARQTLARRVEWLSERVQDLMRELLHHEWFARTSAGAASQPAGVPADLREKSVLCIGQDESGAGLAQQAIEDAGGRFLHHAGGHGGDDAALEASLVEADLVICQTGCVSHDAYWRVQDHCKRTGKQCVLVEQPQAMHFVRSLDVFNTSI
ncbi:DUF2325 domain-containing protein [Janthinobacterium agaricidamnosum]|uniref:DUF2325 domain-containing protein n=1 Tax=Janthinobacterium agaricidamnosum NBRC 102515 = DSM 9628 TaxID=1349767 RepID=W0V7T6_9BURK|nr:DUF2325 domain-containing protein [Janthinobacterium agaricidamnosum]CDG83670.1 putative uncharacterized protein [Janthinobacterium agaricidamnosum NBRC 102515 = DSM 9628]